MLVAPASATTIAKLAQGIGDNPVTLTALATSAPLVVAPAMDSVMYGQPSVQANLELLKARGRVHRGAGDRAVGVGRARVGPVDRAGRAGGGGAVGDWADGRRSA